MFSDFRIGKDMEGSDHHLTYAVISAFAWRRQETSVRIVDLLCKM
jgi:hypothetical protein